MELGRQIRKVFIPKEDYLFVDAEISNAVLCVGYQDITNSVNKLIKEF